MRKFGLQFADCVINSSENGEQSEFKTAYCIFLSPKHCIMKVVGVESRVAVNIFVGDFQWSAT